MQYQTNVVNKNVASFTEIQKYQVVKSGHAKMTHHTSSYLLENFTDILLSYYSIYFVKYQISVQVTNSEG